MKKFNDILNENKRKQKIIVDKTKEVTQLREEIETLRNKAKERDQFN